MVRNAISKVTWEVPENNGEAPNPCLEEVRRDKGMDSQGKLPGRGDTPVFKKKLVAVQAMMGGGGGTKGCQGLKESIH